MNFIQRPLRGEQDTQLMTKLAQQTQPDNLHVVDLPYRFSSWALDDSQNTSLWFDSEQNLVAWAIMQSPFWSIDYVYTTDVSASLHPQILAWADTLAYNLVDTPYGRPAWFINVFVDQHARIIDLEAAGFASQADVGEDSWTKVLMQRSEDTPLTETKLPEGFHIRPLNGETEVEAYVTMHQTTFESKSMTNEWRKRALQQPDYIPTLDLVAVAPDGSLAAFCICWMKSFSGHNYGHVEPLGVHPNYRRLGLGSCLLKEGLKRLTKLGAERTFVETDNYRNAAFKLYERVGFRVYRDVLVYRKDYGEF